MLKVAIVGCGKIADSHASQIRRIPGCQMVGACDREPLMAKQLCERFSIAESFTDLDELIDRTRPDVVHITTPPQSHFDVARYCLEHGCHVYVEKPFTLNTSEAQELIGLAERTGLKVTVGHDDQFRHVARRMRKLIKDGFLGGQPLHMESYYCYELDETSNYAKALLADKNHWVRGLPGKLLHNIISHGIARIAEYLNDGALQVTSCGFPSLLLRKIGETEIIDELRVTIREDERVTAYFTFSSQMRPALHQFRVYGPENGLILDQDNETLITLRGKRYKSYLEQFLPPLNYALQYAGNFKQNLGAFLLNDFHPKAGMKFLIQSFYECIVGNLPVPIPYREILLTSRIMESIFNDLSARTEGSLDRGRELKCRHPLGANSAGRLAESLP
ncbi:MAG TPA: Gfo/Idh/MocA family oxidoreductase [Chthoniobacterales bacterium]